MQAIPYILGSTLARRGMCVNENSFFFAEVLAFKGTCSTRCQGEEGGNEGGGGGGICLGEILASKASNQTPDP